VEAVRAGAHGRGFAVVAEEVRNLAQRSAAAAKEVRDLIAQSRNQIGAVVASVKQADASIGQVVAAVSNARTRVTRIAEACDFQSRAVDQIDATIERLSGITTLNAAAVERGVDVSDTLGLEAQRLVELVQRFQLDAANSAPPQDANARLPALPR
jgi:methyl-accepting chemotaxis protein